MTERKQAYWIAWDGYVGSDIHVVGPDDYCAATFSTINQSVAAAMRAAQSDADMRNNTQFGD